MIGESRPKKQSHYQLHPINYIIQPNQIKSTYIELEMQRVKLAVLSSLNN